MKDLRARLSEGELSKLIRQSDRRHVLNVSYGPSGAFLTGPDWAFEALLKIRAAESVEVTR